MFLDGVTGIAILINQVYRVNISLILLTVSIPFLLVVGFTLTKQIVIKSLPSITALAVFIHFENFSSLIDDKLLIAIFGGIFLGQGSDWQSKMERS